MNEHMNKKQLSLAYRYAYTRLILDDYMYCEEVEKSRKHSEQMEKLDTKMHQMIFDFLEQKLQKDEVLAFREEIKKQMERITMYTDCFQIYESVLNHLEGRFREDVLLLEEEEQFTRKVMAYITGSKDNMLMNQKIQEVVGELPIRLTKNKFAALVQEGLSAYTGSDKSSLETVFYLLRTTSMMDMPKELETEYPNLFELLVQFKKADYKEMDAEEYHRLEGVLKLAIDYIEEECSICLSLQELVNNLTILVLTQKNVMVDAAEDSLFYELLMDMNQGVREKSEEIESILENMVERISLLEGKQEEVYERYLQGESQWLKELSGEWKETGRLITLLLSGSPFAELGEECVQEEADKVYVMQKGAQFLEEFQQNLSGMQKPVARALMANVLSRLPVFFNSINEIEQYVRGSLESCADPYEKGTCMNLIQYMMESEDALV